jgi:hypothetical protein
MKRYFHQSKLLVFFCLPGLWSLILTGPACRAQTEPQDPGSITVTGRVSMQQRGKDNDLILHSTDGTAYLIKGDLTDQLQQIAQKKADVNLVTITGIARGSSSVSCKRTNAVTNMPDGSKAIQTEVRCIRYLHLDARSVVSVAESTRPLPPLKRDSAAESKMLSRAARPDLAPPDIGEIYGTITACNFKSAVTTIDVLNIDKKSPLRSITVLITADTKIAKRIGSAKPADITPDRLKPGQRVTVVYSKNDIRADAMFITVTKE